MPHLVQMDKRYGEKGLVIIGDEVQGAPADRVKGIADQFKVQFPFTRGSTRPPTMRGIPHAVIFDVSGQLIFAGHPGDPEFERTVKKALKEVKEEDDDDAFPAAPKPMIESRDWTNADGKTIRAEVMRVEGDKVIFKIKGREVRYPLENLSEDDQKFIAEAVASAEDE